MKSLHLTTRIAADGMLHLPAVEFAGQEVEVIVSPLVHESMSPSHVLIGQEALNKAKEIGFIGSFEAEPDFSATYKNRLDWSNKR
ncbi:hypothetical protein [uncultured Thiocystis sp.]|jgi:hypothetical protein|uniref:hypothetical protein n=1 Tax=uncultured Thiocystis sp. TaxID=1202134 RepID=UPI0026007C4A|nr:hypothetical protein [uncultured Thiocystis sp.]